LNKLNLKIKKTLITKPALSNLEIEQSLNSYDKNQYFRGVYLRDTLPESPLKNELGILNLDQEHGFGGTHWTLYLKHGFKCFYFDSFGYGPPEELLNYLKNDVIYSTFIFQDVGEKYCGYLCLLVAEKILKGKTYAEALLSLL